MRVGKIEYAGCDEKRRERRKYGVEERAGVGRCRTLIFRKNCLKQLDKTAGAIYHSTKWLNMNWIPFFDHSQTPRDGIF